MIKKKNTFAGASFDYTSSNENCVASGEYRTENGLMASVNINGRLTKDEKTYNFQASRDVNGNVNITGVSYVVIADVAAEVATIIDEVEAKDKANEE